MSGALRAFLFLFLRIALLFPTVLARLALVILAGARCRRVSEALAFGTACRLPGRGVITGLLKP